MLSTGIVARNRSPTSTTGGNTVTGVVVEVPSVDDGNATVTGTSPGASTSRLRTMRVNATTSVTAAAIPTTNAGRLPGA